jgi:putative salt-induced outer membrane protein YdiY
MKPAKYLFVLPILAAVALLLSAPAGARPKADVIILANGDRITGEIIELKYGQLTVKTDSLGTVYIEWLDVARIESPYTFFIESNANNRYSGGIAAVPATGHLVIADKSGIVDLPVTEVAMLSQLEAGFFERLSGSVSFGFSQTKSSGVSSLTFDSDTEYRSDKVISELNADFNSTNTNDQNTLNQYSLGLSSLFLRPGDKFWLALTSFESNEQQGIDGRLTLGAARGRYWVRKPDAEFSTFVGIAGSQEWATGSSGNVQSAEGLLGLQWKVFRFKDPETTLTTRLIVLPSLTDSGRYRSTADISLRHEIVNDLYFELSFDGAYDNRPPDIIADTIDYSITTSLGYKF